MVVGLIWKTVLCIKIEHVYRFDALNLKQSVLGLVFNWFFHLQLRNANQGKRIDNCWSKPLHREMEWLGHYLVSVPTPSNCVNNWWGPPLPKEQ